MRIKLFRAATIALAMAEIRDALGLDALILDTVRIEGGVEITAALEEEEQEDDAFSPLPGVIAFGEDAKVAESAPLPVVQPWARHNLPPEIERALSQEPVEAVCQRLFRFAPLPLSQGAPPLMLVGPPGSGKTLTIAKLATKLVLAGQTPLVVTADERRAGAVEQLAGFTRLLGLTLIAAGRPETLARALSRRVDGAPVLIDAPGLDFDDPLQNGLMAELLAAARAAPVLVLPCGIDPLEAAETAQAAADHGARHLLATRLDRRGRLGGILSAARAGDLALTEAGIAAAVANGLEILSAETIARRLASDAVPDHDRIVPPGEIVPFRRVQHGTNVLSAHIAAQAGSNRMASWKKPS
ncbi:GTPase [Acetobacteraceae bacterium KSS8]|uniref:GTPase n=1 Tax=Endosaccharibacter trunci TaxID=2812733 RepID=A0ABT1WAN8_9PROT|nr:GTPase [Acetobacteraceae bacterium KSS8]